MRKQPPPAKASLDGSLTGGHQVAWLSGLNIGRLGELAPLIPRDYGRYYEPFVGGGALFFHCRPQRATIADVNAELIDCYTAVRDNAGGVIAALALHRYDKDHYYEVRAQVPADLTLSARAARTIFLNKTGSSATRALPERRAVEAVPQVGGG